MQKDRQNVVLVGAGHAHLHVADSARRLAAAGIDVTLVDDGAFWYSGMATGMLGGMYSPEQDQVDSQRLIESRGGRFVRGRVVGLNAARQAAMLGSGEQLAYDAISFNVGSEVALGQLPRSERLWTVKPIHRLMQLREHLQERFARGETVAAAVIGGGATGCEVAANLDALARRRGGQLRLTLLSRSDRLLRRHAAGASRFIADHLKGRGIDVRFSTQVTRVEDGEVVTDDGQRLPCDLMVAATGLRAPAWLADLGLPTDERSGLRVDAMLRSLDDPRVFGAGDCIEFAGQDLPKLGVFGVRQSPVLLHNLQAMLSGKPLRAYHPQKRYLAILNLGDGTALALRGQAYWHGRSALWLKDRIDRRFLAKYRR